MVTQQQQQQQQHAIALMLSLFLSSEISIGLLLNIEVYHLSDKSQIMCLINLCAGNSILSFPNYIWCPFSWYFGQHNVIIFHCEYIFMVVMSLYYFNFGIFFCIFMTYTFLYFFVTKYVYLHFLLLCHYHICFYMDYLQG